MYEKCWKLSYWSQRLGNITQFKVYLKYSFSQTHMHLDEQVLFLEKVEHMVWFYEQKTCLFLCCANGLPLTPFTLFFSLQHKCTHTHLPPTLHTSTLQHNEYIHEWKSVERNTMHQTQHTSFLSVRQIRMEKTLKDKTRWQVGLLTAVYFSLPWERAKRKNKM